MVWRLLDEYPAMILISAINVGFLHLRCRFSFSNRKPDTITECIDFISSILGFSFQDDTKISDTCEALNRHLT